MITPNTKNPPTNYTDSQWQSDLKDLKSKIKKNESFLMPTTREALETAYQEYHGKTQYHRYCDFINNILKNIRDGHIDYCFYIYQIAELLKYEHDNLRATWLNEERCFRVFLAN